MTGAFAFFCTWFRAATPACLAVVAAISGGAAPAQPTDLAELSRLPPLAAPEAIDAAAAVSATAADSPPKIIPPAADPMPGLDAWITPYWPGWIEWDGAFEIGLNGTEGNTETFNIHTTGKLKRKTDWVVQTFEARWIDKSAAGVNTARNGQAEGRTEWPWKDSPWSLFVHGLAEYDEFRAYDMRVSGDMGVGYEAVKTDVAMIKLRFGGSTSYEINGPEKDPRPELISALELERQLSERQKLSMSTEYYPDVTDFGDYRLNTRASWEVVVDPAWGLSLKLSALNRYDSTPNGSKPNDIDYSAVLLWSF